MLGRALVKMIIIPAVIITLSNGIVNKSFANENKTEYVISQSEESKFLEDIYKTETDELKIKNIEKKADGTDLTTIGKYVGHFENTSYLDGNVCLCSHNRGSQAAYFRKIKNLSQGDIITYITKYETKQYEVKEVRQIQETDLSVLNQTENNTITLITCVENHRDLRLCVVGYETAI